MIINPPIITKNTINGIQDLNIRFILIEIKIVRNINKNSNIIGWNFIFVIGSIKEDMIIKFKKIG